MTAASPYLFFSSPLNPFPPLLLALSLAYTHTHTKSRLPLHQTLAAVNTALASLLADKTTAERRQTSTCQKERKRREERDSPGRQTPAVLLLGRRRALLVLGLALGRAVVHLLLGRGRAVLALRGAVAGGRLVGLGLGVLGMELGV
jgi:hypothetical protein